MMSLEADAAEEVADLRLLVDIEVEAVAPGVVVEMASPGARKRAVESVVDGAVTAAAGARWCRREVELVEEEPDEVSFPFTSARYAAHSWSQFSGSAMANSRNAFVIGLSCFMAFWWWGKKNWVEILGNFGGIELALIPLVRAH